MRIRVARKDGAKLKRAVRAAKLPKRLRKQVRYVALGPHGHAGRQGRAALGNDHARGEWGAGSSGGSTAAA